MDCLQLLLKLFNYSYTINYYTTSNGTISKFYNFHDQYILNLDIQTTFCNNLKLFLEILAKQLMGR